METTQMAKQALGFQKTIFNNSVDLQIIQTHFV
jgi:hypothetical protein